MARYGLLECGKNFKGTLTEICDRCHSIDDENHRLNDCIKWKATNLYEKGIKVNFVNIYSEDIEEIRVVLTHVTKVWNTMTAHGTMNL